MSTGTILAGVAAGLAALDLSAENARIAAISAEIADLEAARKRANVRREEISALLSGYQAPTGFRHSAFDDASASVVADRLIAGADPSDAAASLVDVDALQRESETLRGGVVDLTRRINAAQIQSGEVQAAAQTRLHPIVAPLVEDQIAQAIDAARVIEQCFATLSAVGFAAGFGVSEAARAKGALLQGAMNPNGLGLISMAREIAVPADVQAALLSVRGLGPAYTGHSASVVHLI